MSFRSFRISAVRVAGLAATVAAATVWLAPSADAFVLQPNYWRTPGGLSICFDNRTYSATSNDPARWPLPAAYHAPISTAVDGWNRTPTPILFALSEVCTSDAHIRVHGVRSGRWSSGGSGGCSYYTQAYGGYRANECIRGTGFVYLNTDIPIGSYARYFVYTSLHELGHVIGLDHANDARCRNTCYGPVMSYGSCPSETKCVTTIATDDINGVNRKYNYRPSSGGGGSCRTANAVEKVLEGVDTSIERTDDAGRTTDENVTSAVESSGFADTVREHTGQDPLETYGAVTGTVGKLLWPVQDLVVDPMPNC